MAIVVREAVETVAAPAVCDRILHRALHTAQEPEVPIGGDRLLHFVERHLRAAVRFILDEDSADAVVRTLGPPVQMALPLEEITEVRPRTVPPRADPETIPASGQYVRPFSPVEARPCAFVGPDGARYASLVDLLGRPVTLIEDAIGLLEALELARGVPLLIVIDCAAPTVLPTTVATIAPDLPAGSLVVLWGAAPGLEIDLGRLAGVGPRWMRVDEDATVTAVLAAAAS